ncbi:MAG: response regulator transcription factor [Lachnospiraceae bacterium]|nr:response regulator transcription factor [Lachnospiraceae bacterium]
MEIAVCDDEVIIREQIGQFIKKRVPDCNIGLYATGEELLAAGKIFDLVFLDIQMEGISGMETARVLRQKQEEILLIFITGLREYVFEAFDVSAFHYLLKPIEDEKLEDVLKRVLAEVEKRKGREKKQLLVKTRNRSMNLDENAILYLESRGKKVEIHILGETIEVYVSMNKLEERLGESFYRCHRGYLVNMAHIVEYRTDRIRLNNGEEVYLAKEKYQSFVKTYMRYLQNGGMSHG